VDVRPLNGDEWQLKRDLRLAALQDSPAAFASTYAREAHRAESEWRDWPRGGAFFAAFGTPAPAAASSPGTRPGGDSLRRTAAGDSPDGRSVGDPVDGRSLPGRGGGTRDDGARDEPVEAVGIAGAWVTAADPRTTHLISMWVTPSARGRRVAALLTEAVVDWAREHDTDVVELEVAAGNTAAVTTYLRCGFAVTDRDPFTPGGTVLELPVRPPK
jgi:GNAT superfamily N-acetyltransferase